MHPYPARDMIAIAVYPGVQMSAVLGLTDLFEVASRYGQPLEGGILEVATVSFENGRMPETENCSAVIVPPNLSHARGEHDTAIHAWLNHQHACGALVCSVCAGAFWLAHAGLLKGRVVTTHWALAEEFRTSFPDVHVNTGHLLIDDNDIVTAGGLMAWTDLGLFLINQFLGPQAVSQTARHFLIDPAGREQRNYRSFNPCFTHGDEEIRAIQHWLEGHSGEDITVAGMAARVCMSQRTFLRRFKAAAGLTPNTYLQALRVEKARGLLECTRLPVSEIGWRAGYRDASAFSRIFYRTTGLTAGDYRKRFGIMARKT